MNKLLLAAWLRLGASTIVTPAMARIDADDPVDHVRGGGEHPANQQ
jgi:hypothetical protein